MANSEFSNIDFAFRYGSLEEIDRTSISNGTFYIDINNGNLSVDVNSTRISLSDIIFGYTETQIRSMPMPSNKVYFAKDTYNILFFDYNELAWKNVGEHSTYALMDENGRIIHQTYETQENAATVSTDLQNQITLLDQKVDTINRFDIKFYNSIENLPEIGTKFVIYIVPNVSDNEDGSDTTENSCVEYIWIETGANEGYYEQIGLATVDLKNYYTKTESDSKFETKTDAATKKSNLDNSINQVASNLNTYKNEVAETYITKESATEDISSVSTDLDLYKTEVAETYATKTGLSDSVAAIENSLNDYAKKSQSITSVSINNGKLKTTTVSGTENSTNITTTIKNMVGIEVITVSGGENDVMDYGDEDK